MPRYRHTKSGAVVDVRDDKVMDGEWEPVEKPAKKAPAKKSAVKKG